MAKGPKPRVDEVSMQLALSDCACHDALAAETLGVSRQTVANRLRKLRRLQGFEPRSGRQPRLWIDLLRRAMRTGNVNAEAFIKEVEDQLNERLSIAMVLEAVERLKAHDEKRLAALAPAPINEELAERVRTACKRMGLAPAPSSADGLFSAMQRGEVLRLPASVPFHTRTALIEAEWERHIAPTLRLQALIEAEREARAKARADAAGVGRIVIDDDSMLDFLRRLREADLPMPTGLLNVDVDLSPVDDTDDRWGLDGDGDQECAPA